MIALIGIAMLVIFLPLILRALWFVLKAHVSLIALFLPAGLLLRYGGIADPDVYLAITALWGIMLLALMHRRSAAES